MTLAKILIFCVASTAASLWNGGSQAAQTYASPGGTRSAQQEQPGQPAAQTEAKPAAPKDSSPEASTPSKTTHKPRRKKKASGGCSDSAEQATNGAPSTSSNAGETQSSQEQKAASQMSGNCPPAKIIVRRGGTSEPSIQLAGGAKPQPSEARATTAPMLEATEANLKKLEGRQLSDTQKDMVVQIRQFMEQSNSAVAAGDVDRARTLAWKAQTLSEDLVNPAK